MLEAYNAAQNAQEMAANKIQVTNEGLIEIYSANQQEPGIIMSRRLLLTKYRY